MSSVTTEQVMVVKTELFCDCGYFQGFCTDTQRYLDTLLDPANTQYLPRDQMEQDPSYKQLIPYCIFQHIDDTGKKHLFQYTRGKGGGESRLRSKKSIGVGGHISSIDANDTSAYLEGMRRELDEEIQLDTEYEQKLVGLLNDDQNDVGKVHLGIVHLFTVEKPKISSRESDLAESGFVPIEQMLTDLSQFETWSEICLTSLFAD